PSTYGNGAGYKPMQHWTTRSPVTAPQPGAGIGIVCGETFSAIDIDCDDEMRTAIEKVIPESLIGKRGRRGATWFYRGGNRRSRKFLVNGRTVCEVLGVGKQTVLPPSIHPDTGKPYEWTRGFELLDADWERDLPVLPDDIEDRIITAIRSCGGEVDEEKPERVKDETEDEIEFATPHGELNALAIKAMAKWVPDLGL